MMVYRNLNNRIYPPILYHKNASDTTDLKKTRTLFGTARMNITGKIQLCFKESTNARDNATLPRAFVRFLLSFRNGKSIAIKIEIYLLFFCGQIQPRRRQQPTQAFRQSLYRRNNLSFPNRLRNYP